MTSVRPWTFLERTVAIVAIALGSAVTLLIAYFALDALLLLFAGALFGIFLHGFGHTVSRWSTLSYAWSLALILLVMTALCAGIIVYSAQTIIQQAGELQNQLDNAVNSLVEQARQYELLRHYLGDTTPQRAVAEAMSDGQGLRFAQRTVSWIIGAVAGVLVVVAFGIYFAAQPQLYTRIATRVIPPARRARFREVLEQLYETLWAFIIARLISMAIITVVAALGLWMLGISYAALLGLLTGIAEFVPYVGPILAAVPPLLLGFQQGPQTALYVFILYMVLQLLESYLVTPIIQRHEVHLPPVVTIFALLAIGMLTGPLGVVLGTPLAAVAMVLIREFYIVDLLGDSRSADPNRT